MKDRSYIVFVIFLVAALVSVSCRLVSGTEALPSSPKDRQTVPGSSGRPAKANGSADGPAGAPTRTLAPPAGSTAMGATAFQTGYTPAAPLLAPLSMMVPADESGVATEAPVPTPTIAPTQTPDPAQSAPTSAPAAAATATHAPATATQAAAPTVAGAATATPTLTLAPTATTAGNPYPGVTPTATNSAYPDIALTATPTLSVTETLTPSPTPTLTPTVTPGE